MGLGLNSSVEPHLAGRSLNAQICRLPPLKGGGGQTERLDGEDLVEPLEPTTAAPRAVTMDEDHPREQMALCRCAYVALRAAAHAARVRAITQLGGARPDSRFDTTACGGYRTTRLCSLPSRVVSRDGCFVGRRAWC